MKPGGTIIAPAAPPRPAPVTRSAGSPSEKPRPSPTSSAPAPASSPDATQHRLPPGEVPDLSQDDTLPPGTVVDGKYRVMSVIGQGGMGTVYRAEQLNLRREVALKLLAPALATNDLGRKRFEREARVAATLQHPVAVKIFDVGADGVMVYIAMELLRGFVLRDLMQDGIPMALDRTLEIVGPLVDVLDTAHTIPLVHRDLKPENVFIEDRDEGRTVRVLDFGLAFVEGDEGMGRLTKEGLVVGTPAYLSPEQAQGKQVGPPGDVYSLGCMLYEMATGWPPFLGSWMNVLTQHLYVAPVPLRERAPEAGIPSDLDALVLHMLAKQPHERPSMSVVRDGLARVSGTLAGARHRGRGDRMLGERTDRMISVPAALAQIADDAQLPTDIETVNAGFVGELTKEIAMAMASNGVRAIPIVPPISPRSGETPQVSVVVITSSDLAELEKAAQLGAPVVAIADTSDVEQISQMLRAGVADVVPTPVRIEDLTRKVRRAHARSQRKRRKPK